RCGRTTHRRPSRPRPSVLLHLHLGEHTVHDLVQRVILHELGQVLALVAEHLAHADRVYTTCGVIHLPGLGIDVADLPREHPRLLVRVALLVHGDLAVVLLGDLGRLITRAALQEVLTAGDPVQPVHQGTLVISDLTLQLLGAVVILAPRGVDVGGSQGTPRGSHRGASVPGSHHGLRHRVHVLLLRLRQLTLEVGVLAAHSLLVLPTLPVG